MLRIVYVSTATEAFDPLAMVDLLTVSRRNNARCGVTGLLVAHEGCFFQCLEGPEQPVLATLQRIEGDRRHSGLVRLGREEVASRIFPDWNMGYVRPEDLSGAPADSVVALRQLREHGLAGGDGAAPVLLRSFLSNFRGLAV